MGIPNRERSARRWFGQLTPAQEARMYEILRGIADDPHALEMQQFIQHGTVTTYEHCRG